MTSQKSVLFLSPHPDDHIMCAGLMLKLRDIGWKLGEVLFTDGSKGGDETIRKRRFGEYRKACEFLKVEILHNFHFVNRSNWESSFQIDDLIDLYQKFSPTILILPNLLDYHNEHRIVAQLGIKAVLASNIYRKQTRMPIVLFANGFLLSTSHLLINITDVYEGKKELMKIYSDQMTPYIKQRIEAESLYFGTLLYDKVKANTTRAEAYSIPKEWPVDLSSLIA